MEQKCPAWALLVTNLPGRNQTLRMRIWRALKTAGAVLLRDGAYLLPGSATARQIFQEQCIEIRERGGSAYVLMFESEDASQQDAFVKLFDRTAEIKVVFARVEAYRRELAKLPEPTARRQFAALTRDVAAIAAIDFFPGKPQSQLRGGLKDAEAAFVARFEPDEPRPAHRAIARRNRKDFKGRTWATRERLWIDRVCSAWLIRRFIDPKAKFLWLKRPGDNPKRAVGFDFDGAAFTHIDSKVTFEVLVASFALDSDPALMRLGALVHSLDVGGLPVPEAAGFAAIVSGLQALHSGDDALLRHISPVLDSLYHSYSIPEREGSKS
jgi:hypothetical protein